MSASLILKQAMRAPLATIARPASPSFARLYSTPNSNSSSSSTAVTDTQEPVALQAEIISGAPEEVRLHPCRIYKACKAATQSGIHNTAPWRLDFDTELEAGRFENELIGWASSADYMQALQMKFNTKEDAIAFADKQGWEFTVQEPSKKVFKKKIYADNFKYSPTKLRFVKTK
ncbi:hypothetical protein EDD11_008415 [Mortierella claussenii]|nr:hypothetical protein EDD11_008415 [Mortierella claussenii]